MKSSMLLRQNVKHLYLNEYTSRFLHIPAFSRSRPAIINSLWLTICLIWHPDIGCQFKNKWRKERNVLFNDALNTFYLRLYGVRTILIVRKETRCRHMGYSFRLAARVLLYAPSHRQDSTYHSLCYTSHGALAGTRNSSMGPPHEASIRRPIAPWANALSTELHQDQRSRCSFN